MTHTKPRSDAPMPAPHPARALLPSLTALPTREIRLPPAFIAALRAAAPRPRPRALRYGLALVAAAALGWVSFQAPLRARAVAVLHGGWSRATSHIETPAVASEPPPVAVAPPAPTPDPMPVTTSASVVIEPVVAPSAAPARAAASKRPSKAPKSHRRMPR